MGTGYVTLDMLIQLLSQPTIVSCLQFLLDKVQLTIQELGLAQKYNKSNRHRKAI